MPRKSMVIGGIAAAVLIVGGIAAASTNKGNTATASVPAAPLTVTKTAPPPSPLTTTVTRVVDGDTVETTDTAGTVLTIRIIGIDAPEMGTCEGPPAAEAMAAIALNHTVTLQTGGDGEDLDKYGRSLRYVDLDTATDAGLTLIRQGHAIARYDSRDGYGKHTREDSYIAADALTPNYVCTPVPTQEPAPAPAPVPDTNAGSDDNNDTDVHVAPAPEPAPTQEREPAPQPQPEPAPAANPVRPSAYYANCSAARAAGAAPLYAGEPGYSSKLDRDKDGVACE